jgi:hypothetical protein
MHDRLSTEEKKRALVGSAIAAVGAVVLGVASLDSAGTLLLAVYFGGGLLLAVLAVTLAVSLR